MIFPEIICQIDKYDHYELTTEYICWFSSKDLFNLNLILRKLNNLLYFSRALFRSLKSKI